MVNIPILESSSPSLPTHHYSFKIGEDFAQKLKCAKTGAAKVELCNGRPVALLIDGLKYSLIESQESQRIELVSCSNEQMTIEGCIGKRLALDHVDSSKMKERTERAELQRSSRKTVQLERVHFANSKATMKRLNPDNSAKAKKVDARAKENGDNVTMSSSLKDQLIHLLAIEDMTIDSIALKLGCSTRDLSSLLPTVTVPNGILFKLRSSLHSSVDVHNWPKYSARERQIVARRLGLSRVAKEQQQQLPHQPASLPDAALRPADAIRLADERVRQMMKSTRRKKK